MPIYDYHCDHCGHAFSAVRSFTDDTPGTCPKCGAVARRLITAPAIVFKGSGWYKTDSRAPSPASKHEASAPADKTGTAAPSKAEPKAETKAETKGGTKGETKTDKG